MATAEQKVDTLMKNLKKKRASLKCRLTHFKRYVNSFENVELSAHQRAELKLRVVGSQSLMNDFNSVQTQIEDISSESEVEVQLTSREEFERDYYIILALAECLTTSISDEKSSCKSDSNANNNNNSIKLPVVTIPSYDGNYENWINFRDVFLSLVHNSKTIPPIQKFHYLKSSLINNAKSVIESLEFSAANYQVAWELLLNRFDNTKLLVHNHVKSIFSISSLSKESPIQIRKLIDTVLRNLRALKLLGQPIEYWDTLIIYIVGTKLDPISEREWEQHKITLLKDPNSSPKLDDLLHFLKCRADILETIIVSHSKSGLQNSNDTKRHLPVASKPSQAHCHVATNKKPTKGRNYKSCLMCEAQHPLYSCQKFLDLSAQNRLKFINEKQLCINCMRPGHAVGTCMFGPCRKCDQKHNSLICDTIKETKSSAVMLASPLHEIVDDLQVHSLQAQSAVYVTDTGSTHTEKFVLLSTAIVELRGQSGVYHQARAVLDSGSERSFISQPLCNKLNAQILQSTQQIHGIGDSITQCTKSCFIDLKSRIGNYTARIQCLVLPQITSKLPTATLSKNKFIIPDNVVLADPSFYKSQPIDLLIGADLFWELIKQGQIRLKNGPFLQNTQFGWIVSGSIQSLTHKQMNHIHCNFASNDSDTSLLNETLRKFWDIEELPNKSDNLGNLEERACEDHFTRTTTRHADGRFRVRFPLKQSLSTLGETRAQAERRFFALEKRLQRNPDYKNMYKDFIHEYINLGHMSLVNTYGSPHYFLAHHGVFREQSLTTKLRVVFDASMSSSSGVSLNDLQMAGCAIQGDLLAILLRFRENRYVACADVEKMYRSVIMDDEHRDLQLILWRDDPSEPLRVYKLNTVTYGTKSGAFLSCRCLKQLALECEVPYIKDTINNCFYVDDLICSNNDMTELIKNCEGTDEVLKSGGFYLRKWLYNFDRANPNCYRSEIKRLALDDKVNNKTLGVGWNNKSDQLSFYSQIENDRYDVITKRVILSIAAQIYDPLGLVSPLITISKAVLQKCWLLKLLWDESVPPDVAQIWLRFTNSLSLLSCLQIPRHVICIDPVTIELHIFTDASLTAYGACAYLRSINKDSVVIVRLLCAKSKIAPTKSVSVPRLELLGATIGVKLFQKIKESLRSKFNKVVFWTDSTIVLGWLGMPTNLLKPFVQNRTSEIHSITGEYPWRHIAGKQNPADIISRGQYLDALATSKLWWEGPDFLHKAEFRLPDSHHCEVVNLPEIRSNIVCHVAKQSSGHDYLFPFYRFSQYTRMVRAAAYVLRFVHNARNKNIKRMGLLSIDELTQAELTLARFSQQESFPDVYESFINKQDVKLTSQLSKLHPFFDNNKLIRVGGRIQNSNDFNYDKRHPILLHAKHIFSVLLFRYEHHRTLHAAPQLLLYTLRECWWPLDGRNLARKTVHSCMKCARLRATTVTPIMGNLPQARLSPGFPFLRCGVDYGGPVFILNRKGRGARLQKAYICLFVCFVTRAVHIELVTDLSSDAYLLALKRFISRRGKPIEIHSDNGSNFVGLMNEFARFLRTCSDDIKQYAISQSIDFRMIPPSASHFGGLWESGIKSCKYHLRRVVGNAHLTFEELSTVLAQVEAILNSRPLIPISPDPHDFLSLTPAHFLIGRPLTAPVTTNFHDVPASRLTRYQRVEQLRQHFWSRWSKEYVSELQTRSKWHQHKGDLQENMLVLIKDDNLPPLRWSLGRIIKTFPGKDGISRVADIRKANGVVRRAFSKICPLPIDN